MHVQTFKLSLDKKYCVDCQICSLACPKEAISIGEPKNSVDKSRLDIDIEKCNFCGICDAICPFGAMHLIRNGKKSILVVENNSFPKLTRNIKVNTLVNSKDYVECKDSCPLSLISISKLDSNGKNVSDFETMTPNQKKQVKIDIEIQKEYCPTCKVCEFKCTPGLIKIQKSIEGKISINQKKCPKGCDKCVEACPIPDALFISKDSKKVHINELFCVYCGACKVVCPEDEALILKRTKIYHTPTRSGTWNKSLERLTSQKDAIKELKARGSMKAKEMLGRKISFDEVIK